jgi:hypothetical protein
VLTSDEVSFAVESLASMPFFPAEEGARTMIGDALAALCSSGPACFELVRLLNVMFPKWPGVREMRILYCNLLGSPLSGDDLQSEISTFYPEGFRPMVPAPAAALALPEGVKVTADRSLDTRLGLLAVVKDLDRPRRRLLAAAGAPTNPDYKPVTQADIDRAVDEAREKRARAELGEQ